VRRTAALLIALPVLALAACSDDDAEEPSLTGETIPPATAPDGSTPVDDLTVRAGEPFPAARCAANEEAGTITYLTSFDFAAAASILEVLVADEKGYYDELCLDVEIRPGSATSNYPLIAANEAQFSSGGSFGEVVDFAGRNDAGFVALSVDGRTGIETLITKDGEISSLEDIAGTTVGVKFALPASVKAMLLDAGLTENEDYETVLLEGFDPKLHIEVPNIVGFPGWKSNEPGQLEAAGIPFDLWDPADYDIPGSFGIIYTNRAFLDEHPTAAEDFMRATMRGLNDALGDPEAAAQIAVDRINDSGNAMSLSPESEIRRWGVEAELINSELTPDAPAGVPQPDLLQAEVDSFAAVGVFSGLQPDWRQYVDQILVADLYDDGQVIWPS
jgi:ABC-type nitrate/sulfonate/bicarbonate transport system substrate-binding protein